MNKNIFLSSICLLILTLPGCENGALQVGSNAVASKDMIAYIDVVDTGNNSVYIETRLTTDISRSEAYVNLVGGDKLIAVLSGLSVLAPITDDIFVNLNNASKNEKELAKGEALREAYQFLFGDNYIVNAVWYFASFNNAEPESFVQVEFHRELNEPPLVSTVKLPTSLELLSLNEEQIISRSGDIQVTWSPTSATELLTVAASAQCANEEKENWEAQFVSDDPGFVIIPSAAFQGLSGECNIKILVERIALGRLDKQFKQGRIIGRQQRAVVLTTVE